ncbi:hypothetical protein EBX31_14550 [bacterium]|nr:hypothetical protein [bacterium]
MKGESPDARIPCGSFWPSPEQDRMTVNFLKVGRKHCLGLLFLAWVILPDFLQSQIRTGTGPHQANLVFQLGPPPAPTVWFVLSFPEESITSSVALERIKSSHPSFGFEVVNYGDETNPVLFLTSISWQGIARSSEDIRDGNNKLLGGNYWGVFTIPDEGPDSLYPINSPPVGLPQGGDWQESWYGISQRILRDGYWDGYVYQFVSSADWIYQQSPSVFSPRIESLNLQANGSPQLVWNAAPNVAYRIQSTENLSTPFVTRATAIASGGMETWTDPDTNPPPKRFYRVGVVAP